MFNYDEPSAEDRIIKVLTNSETGDCRIGNREYAIMAIKTAHDIDKELDAVLLRLYVLEQYIDTLAEVLSECANRSESIKADPDSDWRRIMARESERRMRAVVDRLSAMRDVILIGDKWVEDYNDIFGKED